MFLALALDSIPARELGDVGSAAGGEPAVCLPQHRTVDDGLVRARRRCLAGAPATGDPGGIDLRDHHQAARLVNFDPDLLQHDRGEGPAAECQHFDGGGCVTALEVEAAGELAAGEVVALLDELSLSRNAAQLAAVNLDFAPDWIGTAGKSLTLLDRIDGRQPIHDGEPFDQRNRAGPQPDQSVGEVGRYVLRPPGANGWRTDGHGGPARYFFFFFLACALLMAAARLLGIPFFFRPS